MNEFYKIQLFWYLLRKQNSKVIWKKSRSIKFTLLLYQHTSSQSVLNLKQVYIQKINILEFDLVFEIFILSYNSFLMSQTFHWFWLSFHYVEITFLKLMSILRIDLPLKTKMITKIRSKLSVLDLCQPRLFNFNKVSNQAVICCCNINNFRCKILMHKP